MAQAHRKDSPINLRALPAQKNMIDMAAALAHKSRSDFMLDAACKEAENLLLNQRLFIIDEEAYQSFSSLMISPVDDNLGLKSLLKSSSPWEN